MWEACLEETGIAFIFSSLQFAVLRGQYLHHSSYQADIKFSQDTGIFISQFHLVKSVSNSFHRGFCS